MNGEIKRAQIQLQTTVQKELQKRIKDLGLYASGALYNSINVVCELQGDKVNLSINAVDYWGNIDAEHKISEFVYNIPSVDKDLNDLIFIWLMSELD